MRIAEGHIGDRNTAAAWPGGTQPIFRNGNVLVRQRRAADGPEMIELYDQPQA